MLGVNRFARNTTLLLSTVALLDLYTFTETYICVTDKLSPFFVCNYTIMYTSVRALEQLNEFYNKQKEVFIAEHNGTRQITLFFRVSICI